MAESKETNTVCGGEYLVGENLGKGGFSFAKLGKHKETGRYVALKFTEKKEQDARQLKEIMTEIKIFQKVKHENVIKCFKFVENCEYVTSNGDKIDTYLMVLELALGGELFDLLYYTGKLEEKVARTYFRQLAAGVEALHALNIVHRDLKPQNLLLDKFYRLKIVDFGSSGSLKKGELLKTYCGTHGFQAPELLLSKNYGPQVDMFAMGVILFIMLTGYPPFKHAIKDDQWFRCIAKNKPESFWKKHNNIFSDKPDLRHLLFSLLCYQPKNRMTMKNLKLDKWFEGEIFEQKKLVPEIAARHKTAFKKRKEDAKRSLEKQKVSQKAAARAVDGLSGDAAKQLDVLANIPTQYSKTGKPKPLEIYENFPRFSSFEMKGVKELAVALERVYEMFPTSSCATTLNKDDYDFRVYLKVAPAKVGLKSAKKEEMVKVRLQARGYTIDDKIWLVFRRLEGPAMEGTKLIHKILKKIEEEELIADTAVPTVGEVNKWEIPETKENSEISEKNDPTKTE